jgi:uncharacterized membrane protein YidH (DUF202 family)
MNDEKSEHDSMVIREVELLLAEKRTSLSVMRTGIAVLALPLSVMSVLVATSRYYEFAKVALIVIPLGVLNMALMILGVYLIIRATLRMRHFDTLIRQIKHKHDFIGRFMD